MTMVSFYIYIYSLKIPESLSFLICPGCIERDHSGMKLYVFWKLYVLPLRKKVADFYYSLLVFSYIPHFQKFNKIIIFRKTCLKSLTLREKCPYSEFFWSVFSRIRTEYDEILYPNSVQIPYSVQMQEDTDQKNSKYGHFLRSDIWRFHYHYHKYLEKVLILIASWFTLTAKTFGTIFKRVKQSLSISWVEKIQSRFYSL